MSIEALKWVFEDAPDVPPHLVATLIGLANHAHPDGKGSYPSVPLLARYTRKAERTVQRELRQLVEHGLIREGDQRYVLHLPAGKRPIVYDLAVERVQAATPAAEPQERGDVDVTPDAHVTGDVGVRGCPDVGVTYRAGRGDVGVTQTPLNQKPPPTRAQARTRGPEEEAGADFENATATAVAEDLVASLPGPLAQSQQQRLTPAVAAALDRGWPPQHLLQELTVDVGSARSRYAVYRHRLEQLPPTPAPTRLAPPTNPSQPQHEFEPDSYGQSCTRCGTGRTNTVHIYRHTPKSVPA